MSKLSLKKELNSLNADQLRMLLLEVYNASKEAKEYLEFYVNPDVDELRKKIQDALVKEFKRGKYRRSKTRISVVKNLVKKYESFGVGPENVLALRLYVTKYLCVLSTIVDFPDTLSKGSINFACETLHYGSKNLIFDKALDGTQSIIDSGEGWQKYMRDLSNAIRNTLAEGKIN